MEGVLDKVAVEPSSVMICRLIERGPFAAIKYLNIPLSHLLHRIGSVSVHMCETAKTEIGNLVHAWVHLNSETALQWPSGST